MIKIIAYSWIRVSLFSNNSRLGLSPRNVILTYLVYQDYTVVGAASKTARKFYEILYSEYFCWWLDQCISLYACPLVHLLQGEPDTH